MHQHLNYRGPRRWRGFPSGLEGKASAHNVGDPGSIPGSGRSPGEGNGNPLQYSCLENPTDGGAWWATVHGVAKSRTWLSNFMEVMEWVKKPITLRVWSHHTQTGQCREACWATSEELLITRQVNQASPQTKHSFFLFYFLRFLTPIKPLFPTIIIWC